MDRARLRRVAGAAVLAAVAAGCGDDGTGLSAGPVIELTVQALAPLDAGKDGAYEVWVVDGAGELFSAGRIDAPTGVGEVVTVSSPVEDPAYLMITVEPPGDEDQAPSLMKLMGGEFDGSGTAELDVTGYLTPVGMPLEAQPGVHVLGIHSGAGGGGGAPADAGLWLVDTRVDSTGSGFFQTFTPLTQGWTYEGWVVRDYGTQDEVWVSYGRFLPNNLRKARFRDDTGLGPFSGFQDYEGALPDEVHFPGDDWVSNPLDLPVPGDLPLPFDLNGDPGTGEPSRWTHVISIEPRDQDAGSVAPWEAEPFFLRPYRNPVGEAPPQEPRTIGFFPEGLPEGLARLRLIGGP